MANFDDAFDETIGLEGGYVNDPDDTGGETKWGIAKRWHLNVDIKNLTKEEAKQIYWAEYWNPLQLALILSDDIATEIFEQAINMGRWQAVIHAQQALKLLGRIVAVDGYMGPDTARAINNLPTIRKVPFIKVLNGLQFMRYVNIVAADPTQKKFFVGWLRRVALYG